MFESSIKEQVTKSLIKGETSVIISFGHKESGKTFTCLGENNYQLQKQKEMSSNDSRGLALRALNEIKNVAGSL